MPFYEVHIHGTEETISRMVIKADSQDQARYAALEAVEKDHDDVVEHALWEDEWVQLGEISSSDAHFNVGDAYWDANLGKWTSPKKYLFANEEGKPVGNPKRLGRSVDWTPYEDRGNMGGPTGPGHRAEDWTAPTISLKVNDSVDAYDLQECPWCAGDMEHEGDREDWDSFCDTCGGSISSKTENIITEINPPTEKWTTDLADFASDHGSSEFIEKTEDKCPTCNTHLHLYNTCEDVYLCPDCGFEEQRQFMDWSAEDPTAKQLVEQFRETIREAVHKMMETIESLPNPTFMSHDNIKGLVDSAFQLGYNSGNIDGKWEMKKDMMGGYAAEGIELETPIVDRAMRLHMMIERATRHAMFTAMQQQALLAMLHEQGPWIEHGAEEIDFDWTPEEFGQIESKELVEEIGDMEDHLGDLENQYEHAVDEDNEDLEYMLEEKIIECKEDIEYLIHLLYEVEAYSFAHHEEET